MLITRTNLSFPAPYEASSVLYPRIMPPAFCETSVLIRDRSSLVFPTLYSKGIAKFLPISLYTDYAYL